MTEKFSTPSKDCLTDEEVVIKVKDRQSPDISHLELIPRLWKAEILLANGKKKSIEYKTIDLNDFLRIIKEKYQEGFHISAMWGGG